MIALIRKAINRRLRSILQLFEIPKVWTNKMNINESNIKFPKILIQAKVTNPNGNVDLSSRGILPRFKKENIYFKSSHL